MIGFAKLAWLLAWERQVHDGSRPGWPEPAPRKSKMIVSDMSPSAEYYRIIDRISCGEKP